MKNENNLIRTIKIAFFLAFISVFGLMINHFIDANAGSNSFLKSILPSLNSLFHSIYLTILFTSLVVGIIATHLYLNQRLPPSYRIAVVGFPKSGKTTLITTMFGEMFASQVLNVVPRGLDTIERINADLAKLEIGEALGPTKDQDLFAYRVDIVRGKFFKNRYKVEIGDFPCEHSEKFAEQFGDWFHETTYFKWAMEADAFIFVVDLAYIFDEKSVKQYVARITQASRAAWQRLGEYYLEGNRTLHKVPVLLVFTKADLFGITSESTEDSEIAQKIMQLGFETIPEPTEIDAEKFDKGVNHTKQLFSDLINYFNKESSQFDCIFVSCFSYLNKERVGIKELVEKVLPK